MRNPALHITRRHFFGDCGVGLGKIALASLLTGAVAGRTAANLAERFEDGAFFVAVATITEADLIPTAIAATLNLPQDPGRSPLDVLILAAGLGRFPSWCLRIPIGQDSANHRSEAQAVWNAVP